MLPGLLLNVGLTDRVDLLAILVCAVCAVRRALRRMLLTSFVVVYLVGALVVLTPVLTPALRAMSVVQLPESADAIVVLGSSLQCERELLNTVGQERLIRGLELWAAGYAPNVVVSAQAPELFGANCPTMAQTAKAQARRLYPERFPVMLELPGVRDTFDESRAAAALVRARQWRRVLLVTSAWHEWRAKRLFEAAGVPEVIAVPTPDRSFDPALPTPADRLGALGVVFHEGIATLREYALGHLR
ncbi:YdcF family protein [Deinococcus yavapaiensis]|uniref:YdcF family protein n=1 Tax=Deinococcus yavapaiensis TaxID=309889 RepID=UPI001475874B|nr:YdcF family protein [Deinococcus yavapaiensis]